VKASLTSPIYLDRRPLARLILRSEKQSTGFFHMAGAFLSRPRHQHTARKNLSSHISEVSGLAGLWRWRNCPDYIHHAQRRSTEGSSEMNR